MHHNLVQFILDTTQLRQKDMAEALGVSPAQVSKWKSGEYMATDRAEALTKMAGMFTDDIEWFVTAQTQGNANSWVKAVDYIYHNFTEGQAYTFDDSSEFYAPQLLCLLSKAGISIPDQAPVYPLEQHSDDSEEFETLDEFGALLASTLDNYSRLMTWTQRHIMYGDEVDTVFEEAMAVESCTLDLAIAELTNHELLHCTYDADQLKGFSKQVRTEARRLIQRYCESRSEAKLPMTADYFQLVTQSSEWLEDEDMIQDVCADAKGIKQHIPYADQLILDEIKALRGLVESLSAKVDNLMAG